MTDITFTSRGGSFAFFQPVVFWIKCRETFLNKFYKKPGNFLFSYEKDIEKLIEFVHKAEEILGCQKTKFIPTGTDYAVEVEPSTFWKSCRIRMEFYTILLRAGLKYKGNFEECLFSEEYFKLTLPAVKRFLFGFTTYRPSNISSARRGWVTIFQCMGKSELRQSLIRTEKDEFTLVGRNALWS